VDRRIVLSLKPDNSTGGDANREALKMLTLILGFLTANGTAQPADQTPTRVTYEMLLREFPGGPSEYVNRLEDRGRAAAARFFAFACAHRDAPQAVEALGWIASHCLYSDSAGEAMARIAQDYARSPDLAPVLARLDSRYGDPFAPKEAMLRVVRRDSPHPVVRGTAALCLAHELSAKRHKAERDADLHKQFTKGVEVPFAAGPAATAADLDRWSAEAASLCESAANDPTHPTRLRAEAEALLQEIRTLAVGRRAPEIEGRDHEGKLFKLSDYRGKVVVLIFSTSACAPCRAMYPLLRDVVGRHKGRPFALLNVYADADLEYLRKAVESGEITWRSWCDGGLEGPILKRWNVSSYPTIFIIDGTGVIRHKPALSVGLEAAVDHLLEKVEHDEHR
jgi:peroxiredoxin